MSIKVCDSIMGSGKTQAAIAYMNSHPEKKFIYITPFLEECERIKEACPTLHFALPSAKIPEYSFKKYKHTIGLLEQGKNIASTHNMFLRYSKEMEALIKEQHYTLIIDEALNVFDQTEVATCDIAILKQAGLLQQCGSTLYPSANAEKYNGLFAPVVTASASGRLEAFDDGEDHTTYLFTLFSEAILKAFDDVIILTYLFESSEMKYYFDIREMDYSNIYTKKNSNGSYEFSNYGTYTPEYTKDLSRKIHIFQDKKINSIGDYKTALSRSWYLNCSKDKKDTIKNNVYNYFRNYNDEPGSKRMWSCFKAQEPRLRGKGYTKCFVPFNEKATNQYKDRTVLAYLVNVYMNPFTKRYLLCRGADVKEDEWALSTMVQWIWRSAIRDGEEINIYIPSSRMRHLLEDWIKDVEDNYQRIYNTNTQEITE